MAVWIVMLVLASSVAERAQANSQDAAQANQQTGQQSSQQGSQQGQQSGTTPAPASQSDPQNQSQTKPPETKKDPDPSQQPPEVRGQQTKRILDVMPNYRAVSANTQVPPLTVKGKFTLASRESYDYTAFVFAGFLSGIRFAEKSDPELGQELDGYGRYYWRTFVDQTGGHFFTEAIFPSLTHEDPRYYTLASGSPLHRTLYALSRALITKKDSGAKVFNYSEVIGNGFAAGLANAYSPAQERSLRNTGTDWGEHILWDALANVIKEFWPDLHDLLHHKN